MCFAEFLRLFYLSLNSKSTDNDYQPEELLNELLEYKSQAKRFLSKGNTPYVIKREMEMSKSIKF